METKKKIRLGLYKNWISYAVIALSLSLQLFLITRSLDFLLTDLLPDDAFYYFEIVRNILQGNGVTFDGVETTNGFHPLWLTILIPIFAIFSVGGTYDVAPVYAALSFSVLLNMATAYILFLLLGRITKKPAIRAIGLAIFALNPFVLYESLNGLETSLALLLSALFFLCAVRIWEHDRLKDYVVAGIVCGGMVLARIDTVFFAIAFFLWLVVWKGLHKSIRPALAFGIPATLFILPWVIWNIINFGMLATSASLATPFVNHTLVTLDNGVGAFVFVKTIAYMLLHHGSAILVATGISVVIFIAIGVMFVFFMRNEWTLPRLQACSPMWWLFAGFVFLFVANAGLRWTGRSWYFIAFDVFVALGVTGTLTLLSAHTERRKLLYLGTVIVVMASFLVGWHEHLKDRSVNQRAMYVAATWVDENIPIGESVGVFNAGIIGYFSETRIVNLDGLVNNTAYHMLRAGETWEYMQTNNISYLMDFPIYLSYRYNSFFGVQDLFERIELIHEIRASGVGAPIEVYRVRAE